MAKIAAPLLTIAGGYFFGAAGAFVGSLLASVLFPPPEIKGPRLRELDFQRSTVGAPVPIVFGTGRLAGNVIFSGGLIETKHSKEVGGFLGIGGQKVTNYTYAVDVAIGICEPPTTDGISGVRRIWADADLIYDSSDDATLEARYGDTPEWQDGTLSAAKIRAMSAQLDFTLYTGTEDQLPDPTIESYKGVGVVPAYRGLAYVMLRNFQLAKYGNRIPSFSFEVYSGAPAEEVDCSSYSNGYMYPWAFRGAGEDTWDPRNPLNGHLYGWAEGGHAVGTTYAAALAQLNAATDHPDNPFRFGEVPQQSPTLVHGWSTTTAGGGGLSAPCGPRVGDVVVANPAYDYVTVQLSINAMDVDSDGCPEDVGGGGGFDAFCSAWWAYIGYYGYPPKHVTNETGGSSGYVALIEGHDNDPSGAFDGISYLSNDLSRSSGSVSPCIVGSHVFDVWLLSDHEIGVRRWHEPRSCANSGTPIAGTTDYCLIDGVLTRNINWTRVAGTFKSLRCYIDNGSVVTSYPRGPTLHSGDPNYSNEAFWTAAYATALAENPADPTDPNYIPTDWVYGVDYPTERFSHATNLGANSPVWQAVCTGDVVTAQCMPMSQIVSIICARAGLRTDTATQIDVSDLTTCPIGYVLGSQMSARDALAPLRTYGLWDCVESGDASGGILKFIERGHAIKATLTADDLGAHELNSDPPPGVTTSRVQEKDLPRRVRVHFPNFLHDHEVSEQDASRITTEAVSEVDVEIPVVMDPDTAAQLAEILLYTEDVARDTYAFPLDYDWLRLEPTDCIEIPVDGQTERVRITQIQNSNGVLNVSAVRDDDGSYVSTAVAKPAEGSGGSVFPPGTGPICPSTAVLLDTPCLRQADSVDAGFNVAVYGQCDTWECADLYRSSDGGLTYGRVAHFDDQGTVGTIDDISGPATDPTLPGDSPPYDSANSITVTLASGELASITDAQIAAGLNQAAIGLDGRWVIVQFKTVTHTTSNTYELTDLIWGENDTEHLLGTTGVGDTFVLLSDPALIHVPESPDAIGQSKLYKIVTCGETLDDVDAFSFTTRGLCYQRPCPATVLSATTFTPPTSPADGDSYLLPNDTSLSGVWATHGGEIATWSDETDSWVYCLPAPGTIIHIAPPGDTGGAPGGDDVIAGGDGTTTPSPWQAKIEPFDEGISLGTPGSIRELDVVGDIAEATLDSSGRLTITFSSGPTLSGFYRFDNSTSAADPGSGDLRYNNATPGSVTNLYLSETSHGGTDVSRILGLLASGSRLLIQQKDDSSKYLSVTVSGTPTDNGAWWTVPVTVVASGTLPDNNAILNVLLAGTSASGTQAGIQFKDEGSTLGTAGTVDELDFVGAGVIAARAGNKVTVTVADRQSNIQFKDEGSNLGTSGTVDELDFVGAGVTATRTSNKVTVTIDGASASVTAWKDVVRVATNNNHTLSSAFENGDTIDGVTLATGDRILIKNQTTATENGIYTVNASGAPTRATDADSGAELVGAIVPVAEGTINADTTWQCTNNATITLGSTSLTFVQYDDRGIPSNHQAGNYTIAQSDNGRCIEHLSGDGVSDVYTIPSHASTPLTDGFTFTVLNLDSNSLQVQITSDTLIRFPSGATGAVTIAQYGMGTFRKTSANTIWTVIGTGLS